MKLKMRCTKLCGCCDQLAAVTKERDEADGAFKSLYGAKNALKGLYDLKHQELAASRAECAVLRGALERYSNSKAYDDVVGELLVANRLWAREALSASSGEALAAVRGAIIAMESTESSAKKYWDQHAKALAELRRVFSE